MPPVKKYTSANQAATLCVIMQQQKFIKQKTLSSEGFI
jgi:hypothetical protein